MVYAAGGFVGATPELLVRRTALEKLGFDLACGRGHNGENDWCQRARVAGYRIGRCNHAFVFHVGAVLFSGTRRARVGSPSRLRNEAA